MEGLVYSRGELFWFRHRYDPGEFMHALKLTPLTGRGA